MKKSNLILSLLTVVMFMTTSFASAQSSLFKDATEVRSAAVLTTADVLSTTFTIPASAEAVHYYVDFTKGSLTSASFAPAGAMDDNPDATGYYKSPGAVTTVDVTGKYHIRVPREDFGAYRYGGIFALGTGTVTSSSAAVSIKFEL